MANNYTDRPSLAVTALGAGLCLAGATAVVLSLAGVPVPAMLWYSFLFFIIAFGFVLADVGYFGPGVDAWMNRVAPPTAEPGDDDAEPDAISDPFSGWAGGQMGAEYSQWRIRFLALLRAAIAVNGKESDCIPRWSELKKPDGETYSSRLRFIILECLPDGMMDVSEDGTYLRAYTLDGLLRAVESYQVVLKPPAPSVAVPNLARWHTGTAEFAGKWGGEGG